MNFHHFLLNCSREESDEKVQEIGLTTLFKHRAGLTACVERLLQQVSVAQMKLTYESKNELLIELARQKKAELEAAEAFGTQVTSTQAPATQSSTTQLSPQEASKLNRTPGRSQSESQAIRKSQGRNLPSAKSVARRESDPELTSQTKPKNNVNIDLIHSTAKLPVETLTEYQLSSLKQTLTRSASQALESLQKNEYGELNSGIKKIRNEK